MPTRLQLLEQMLKEHPTDAFLLYCSALEYEKIQQRSRAIEILRLLNETQPDYLPAYYQLGRMLVLDGKSLEANIVFAKGITLARETGDLKTMNELHEAIEMCRDDEL